MACANASPTLARKLHSARHVYKKEKEKIFWVSQGVLRPDKLKREKNFFEEN
jgi:capsule polysaccharide modification protein KpsS